MGTFTINGRLPDYASVTHAMTGEEIDGIKEFSYKVTAKGAVQRGSGRKPRHKTNGVAEYEASCTMYAPYATALRTKLGNGYMSQDFNWLLVYGMNGQPSTKVEVIGCNISGDEGSGAEGSADAMETKFDLQPTEIRIDGLEPVTN